MVGHKLQTVSWVAVPNIVQSFIFNWAALSVHCSEVSQECGRCLGMPLEFLHFWTLPPPNSFKSSMVSLSMFSSWIRPMFSWVMTYSTSQLKEMKTEKLVLKIFPIHNRTLCWNALSSLYSSVSSGSCFLYYFKIFDLLSAEGSF